MKNFIFIFLLIMMFSCNDKKTVEVDKHHLFNNVNLMEYNGKRVFYLLDTLDRLNYTGILPIDNDINDSTYILGFILLYSDSISIDVIFDSLTFIPKISRRSATFEHDLSWTIDNFLKEKIKDVTIRGVKNGEFIYVFSSQKKVTKKE